VSRPSDAVSNISLLISSSDTAITVTFADTGEAQKTASVQAVLDINAENKAIGIEVINLRHQTGCIVDRPYKRSVPGEESHSAYDPTDDLLYVRIASGRSVIQPTVTASATMDSRHRLLKLDIPISFPLRH